MVKIAALRSCKMGNKPGPFEMYTILFTIYKEIANITACFFFCSGMPSVIKPPILQRLPRI